MALDTHMFDRCLSTLERLSVIYNNIGVEPSVSVSKSDAKAKLEFLMFGLIDHLHDNAKGQV